MPVHSIVLLFFFFNDTATTEIYTLSLHDALPIYSHGVGRHRPLPGGEVPRQRLAPQRTSSTGGGLPMAPLLRDRAGTAGLANRATHFALPTREAARGRDPDRPSGLPRHGGCHGSAHGRPAGPRRRPRGRGRL